MLDGFYRHLTFKDGLKEAKERSSKEEHREDALAPIAEEGRGMLRKALGSRKQA